MVLLSQHLRVWELTNRQSCYACIVNSLNPRWWSLSCTRSARTNTRDIYSFLILFKYESLPLHGSNLLSEADLLSPAL